MSVEDVLIRRIRGSLGEVVCSDKREKARIVPSARNVPPESLVLTRLDVAKNVADVK